MAKLPASTRSLVLTAFSLALVVVVAGIDYLIGRSGFEIDLGPAYLVPIIFAGAWIGMASGVVAAAAAALAFVLVDQILTSSMDRSAPIIALNGVGRAAVYIFVAVLVGRLRSRSAVLRGQSAQLQEELRLRQEYVAIVAHELRNPLAGIKAAATLLARREVDPESATRADGIASEASAGLKLLDDLSEVTRVESGRMRSGHLPLDLDGVLRATLSAIGLTDHPLEVRGPGAGLRVLGDEQRLGQVIRNLISNAAKYSPVDSPIEVTLGVSADRKMAVVSVRDHGVGVPPAERGHLFEKFRRLSSAGSTRGSGLGLYISQEIIRDHGGALTADWPPGGGSMFIFTLPLAN